MRQKVNSVDYILIFLFLAISGNPFFCYWNLSSAVMLLLLLFRIQIGKREWVDSLPYMIKQLRPYLLIFSGIFLLQLLFCKNIKVAVQLNYLVKITVAGLFYLYYKDRFKYYYLNIMTFLAFISIVLYPLVMTGFTFPNIFGTGFSNNNSMHSLIIYNYNVDFNFERNSGMFWEPGCYACYLCLTPLLFIEDLKGFIKENRKKCLILLTALLTTQSTTGFLVVSLLLLIAFWKTNKYIGPTIALFIIFYLITSSVVTDKFSRDLSTIENMSIGKQYYYDGYNTENRLGTIFFLFPIFLLHPIIGNGINNEAMYASVPYLLQLDRIGLGNGFMIYLVQLGLAGVLIYAYTLCKKWKIPSMDRFLTLLIILLLLQGEPLLLYPIFIGLPFYYSRSKTKRLNGV